MEIQTPDWVKNAVFYQIFPDRFARSPRTEHVRGISFKPWGSPPEEQGYQGGDLHGIVDKLDYLQELGITALYLNPIFASAANHRYHTFDYYQVDPLLGGNDALRELLDAAHEREMKVVLDGVFNHASRGFWPFHHILESGGNSPYLDWFHIEGWPLRPYAHDAQHPANYEAWADLPALPKFNTDNPGVRHYLLGVARHWLEFGIDGWRLDVPNEIDDDSFWQEFRTVVKETNPEAYIVGEIWEDASRWLQGDQFDAVMNYPLAWLAEGFFGAETLRLSYQRHDRPIHILDAPVFGRKMTALMDRYPWEITQAQLNLLDSHDTARALWIVGGSKSALRLCALLQITLPGAPCIYYGDEIGMTGPEDPYCRAAFPWNDEEAWDRELLAFYRAAIRVRRQHPVLRTGTFQQLSAGENMYTFIRRSEEAMALIIFNAGKEQTSSTLSLPSRAPETWSQAWPEEEQEYRVENGRLHATIPPRDALILVGKIKE